MESEQENNSRPSISSWESFWNMEILNEMQRRKCIFTSLCAIVFFFVVVSKLYKRTSIWEQFQTPHQALSVEEVILSLSWPPSSSNITSFSNSSSALHSVVRLEQPGAQYCVGDTLSVLVEMRNYAGLPKAHGGDFILARIHSPELQAGASGDVTDFRDGTYRVRFRLFWPGEVQVSVRLIHSSETVKILQRDWMQDYNRAMYTGTFIRGEKTETSQCTLRLSSDRPLCEYMKKEDGGYYACYQPQTLSCSSLTLLRTYIPPDPHLTEVEAQLLDQWSSSFCQTGSFLSEVAITRCLKGKTLYLLGDSTVRQWMEYLEEKLKGLILIKKAYNSKLAVNAHNGITVRWARHSHPWIAFYHFYIKGSVHIPKALDGIAVGGRQEDMIVVIGIGQHFRPYPPEVFIRRLLSIRLAIMRLHARNPQVHIVIKLENNRDLALQTICLSNWYGYMQNLAQRKVFEDMKVTLVDAWDMSVAANSLALHPDEVIVSNQVSVALSFFCH
ncbi:NXPE family member 1-like isoform X2 [Conger conger]|uniref:NXPE family member 1-like isoform X2 n=1 Tax=Conger conger TaxID=82655 RepID=UPI002A59DE50|nr:NXPE family member 1-like isoform X2 [Conger conger]